MYKNEYQGGPYFEVLTPQGKDSLANWKLPGNGFKKVYEKEVKSYVFYIEGSSTSTKIQIPKDPKQSLTLIQRYLIFQLFVGKGQDFLIELGVTDLGNNKRRLFLSTTQKETHVAATLHARVPLTIMKRHKWLNLCIDMVSMVGEIWRGQTYKSVESITVSANCKIRRIFTMKSQPPDNAGDEELYGCPPSNSGEIDQIPKQFQLASDVDQVTQLLNITKIKHAERLKSGDVSRSSALELDLSGRKSSLNDTRYHIAFGTKVPVNPTSARKTKEYGNSTSRGSKFSHSRIDGTHSRVEDGYGGTQDLSDSISSKDGLVKGADMSGQVNSAGSIKPDHSKSALHRRQLSDPMSKEDLEMYSRIEYDKHGKMIVQPHPPREPSSDRLRRRVRVKNGPNSGNKDTGVSSAGSAKDESQTSSPQTKSPPQASRILSHFSPNRPRRTSSESESLNSGSPNDSGIESKPSSSSKADDIYSRKSGEYNVRNYQCDGADLEESVSNVIAMLNRQDVIDIQGNYSGEESSEVEDEGGGEYEESDDEIEDRKQDMFLFVSKPKSAPRRHLSPNNMVDQDLELSKNTSVSNSKGHKRGSRTSVLRGAKPEDDFHNGNESSSDENDSKLRKKLPGSRPHSGSSSRPHSGTSLSRPGSGTSGGRPHSGTVINRPNSGTSSAGASPQTSRDKQNIKTHGESKMSKNSNNANVSKSGVNSESKTSKHYKIAESTTNVDTKIDLRPLQNGPKQVSGSPELSISQMQDSLDTTLTSRSMSRMNRKSLREISKMDVSKMSLTKSTEKPYDFKKYQVAEVTDSFELKMFASMKRQNEEAMEDVTPSPRKTNSISPAKGPTINVPFQGDGAVSNGVLYDFSPQATSDEDSTWQAPPNNPHNFQDEMKGRLSTDTMSSNPRDWSGVFSPPIGLPHELANSTDDFSLSSTSPRKDQNTARTQDTDNEEELDLMYDPCLNCYYDPKTCKYYELI